MRSRAVLAAGGWGRVGLAFLVGIGAVAFVACVPPPPNVLRDNNGEILDIPTIDAVLQNQNLSQDEKRQRLLDLGVPESVADTLLRAS